MPNQGRIDNAAQEVFKQFPRLRGLGAKIQSGEGPGFAEFFPADEGMNPNPGIPTVEIRRKGLPDKELQSVILGDLLHEAPNQLSEIRGLKDKFIKSLQGSQLQVIQSMFSERAPQDTRSFNEFVEQVGADAFIRDYFFQKSGNIPGGKPFVSGVGPVMGAFFEDQVPLLERMRLSLQRRK